MQQWNGWNDCPKCGQLVQYGQSNCLSCGTQLNWPAQQQTQPPPQYQQQSGGWGQHLGDSTGFDWKKSKAHLLLLSKFIHIQRPEYFATSEIWENILGEPSKQAIKRFVDEGMLITADLNDQLSHKYKVPELKEMLRQRSLPVSGHKNEMIQRLSQADTDGMRKAVAELTLLKCTQRGQEIAEHYLVAEAEKRSNLEKQVIEYLTKRKLKEASLTVAAYENEQVFSRGMGIDWEHYDPNNDIETLENIFRSKPQIIAQLENEKLERLRIATAMMFLWGVNSPEKWLPDNFETGLSFDNDTAARMFLHYPQNQAQLEGYRDAGVEKVTFYTALDDRVCDDCDSLNGQIFSIDEAPELPNPNCTNEQGCRCVYLPCVD